MSDTRKYRKFTAQQKTEIVLASLRGPKSKVHEAASPHGCLMGAMRPKTP